MKSNKVIWVNESTHKYLKMMAAKKGTTMKGIIEELILMYDTDQYSFDEVHKK